MTMVQDVMKTNLIWIKPDESLDDAFRIMREVGIRHLPVLDYGELVGVVSEGDILLHATNEFGTINVPDIMVAEVMSTDVVTCEPTTRLAEASETMLTCKLDCLPVVDNKQLVGMITSSDFLEIISENEEKIDGPALPLDFDRRDHAMQMLYNDASGT